MADQTIANRKFFPLVNQNALASTPSSYSTTSVGSGETHQGQSFHDILNRTQLTSSQLRSMQAPQNPSTANRSSITLKNSPVINGVQFIPDPGSLYNQKLIQETQNHLKNVPDTLPEDDAHDQLMAQNMQQYLAQKGETIQNNSVVYDSSQSIPANPPESTSNSQPAATSSALHAILARNAVNPQTLEAENVEIGNPETSIHQSQRYTPISNEPIIEPIPILEPVPMTPEVPSEPAASISGFPAYIPAAQIGSQIIAQNIASQTSGKTMVNPSPSNTLESQESNSKNTVSDSEETQETPSSEHENSGFFQAVGSFFGNIASAATLGFYQPPGEADPQGFARVIDPLKKVVWDAPKSLIVDAPVGAYRDITQKNSTNNEKEKTASSSSATLATNSPEPAYRGVRSFGTNRSSLRRNFYT